MKENKRNASSGCVHSGKIEPKFFAGNVRILSLLKQKAQQRLLLRVIAKQQNLSTKAFPTFWPETNDHSPNHANSKGNKRRRNETICEGGGDCRYVVPSASTVQPASRARAAKTSFISALAGSGKFPY